MFQEIFNQEVFGIRIQALALSAVVLVLAAAGHITLRWWMRRRARMEELQAGREAGGASGLRLWLPRALREMVPPLALLLWIHGLNFALSLLIGEVERPETAARLQSILGWGYRLLVLVTIVWLLVRIGRLAEAALTSIAARSESTWDDVVLPFLGLTLRRVLPLAGLIGGAPALALTPGLTAVFRNAFSIVLIGTVGYLLYRFVDAAAAVVVQQHRVEVTDNLQARAVQTQVVVLKKVAATVIIIFTVASMLMVFDSVQQFGTSILASAGIAGIIVGLAAQQSLTTLLHGFQIAITQPIRIDDVVIVENEWGRIEEITLTYVVVRIWDLRRLVLPISYFIEKPFQNWTRTSANLLATVFLHTDYTVPLDEIRGELTRVLTASPKWDGKVNVLHVTDSKERTLEIRALASAADASAAWDLRCEVREKLVGFLQRNYPESLPRLRGDIETRMATADAGVRS